MVSEVILMEEQRIHRIMLEQYAMRLYTITGKMNLCIRACSKRSKLNVKRLATDVQMIRELVEHIEAEIDYFHSAIR